jgi:hypothetical protein
LTRRWWSPSSLLSVSLVKMLRMCFSTAPSEMKSFLPIALFEWPSAMRPRTSFSRGVRVATGSFFLRRTMSCETTSGSKTVPPPATRFSESMKSSTSITRSFSR